MCSLGAVLTYRDSDIHLKKGIQNLKLVDMVYEWYMVYWYMNVLSFRADLEKAMHDTMA